MSRNGAEGEAHGSELRETASCKRIYASRARKRSMIDAQCYLVRGIGCFGGGRDADHQWARS
jgi:hypothetical protein